MRNKKLTAIILCVLGLMAFRTSNIAFPELEAQTLDDKTINIPKDVKGKFTLIGMASSLKAQNDLEGWLQPVYSSFVGNPMYPVNLYFVAMAGNNGDLVKKQFKKQLDKDLQKYVLVYSGGLDVFKSKLEMKEKDKPYFFIIDPRGQVTYSTSGQYTEKKLEEIADKLSE